MGRRLGELDRVAPSAYVLQNVLGSVLFHGWGLNLGAAPGSWRLGITVLSWIGISAVMLVAAHLWLRRFRRGPLETLTRTRRRP